MLSHSFAAVLPHNLVRPGLAQQLSDFYGRQVRTAVASGWAATNRFAGVDQAFVLSDHADFPGLLSFVEACAPKKVFVTHGFEKEFSKELQKRGFRAAPLGTALPAQQKTLFSPSGYN